MKKTLYLAVIVLAAVITLSSCSVINIYSGEGTILYIGLEGGFYGLIGDNGEHYEVVNLDADYPEFQVDSLRVKYRVKELKDQGSILMWGTIVEALSLKELEDD